MSADVITFENGTASLGRAVVAIGVFDGVHLGHQALLLDAVRSARLDDVRAVAVTFDRDPDQVVTPEAAAPQLLTLDEKVGYISELGVDAVLVIPFCMRLAAMTPDRFLDDVLCSAVEPVAVVVGEDFRFGAHASGTVRTLREYGAERGFRVDAHDLVQVDGEPVTSTRIRRLVEHNEIERANALLGRAHRVNGRVGHGRGEGATVIGVPTANVHPVAHAAVPGDGVYAGRMIVDGAPHPAAISVGVPPTFPHARDYLEAHLIGWEGDLYGRDVVLEFVSRLRDQAGYSSAAELRAQIERDIARVAPLLEELG